MDHFSPCHGKEINIDSCGHEWLFMPANVTSGSSLVNGRSKINPSGYLLHIYFTKAGETEKLLLPPFAPSLLFLPLLYHLS